MKLAKQIGKGFGQLQCSRRDRKDAKKAQHKALRRLLKKEWDSAAFMRRYRGWVS